MNLQRFLYKLKNKINLQFIKQTWLNIKRDRAKAIFAIGGIMISIVLLTAIGMVNDTMSYNYMQLITGTTGNADIMVSKRIKTDLSYDPFFPENIIDNDLQNIEGVEEAYSVYGVYDVVAKIEADSMDKLKEIITWRIRRLNKVRSTLTMIVIE